MKSLSILMMLKVKLRWRDLFFVFMGCIIATVANNWTYFHFNKEISVSDLFTAVLGGFLGLYIGSKLSSDASSDRIEKDLLISELSPLKIMLVELHNGVERNTLSLPVAVQLFKNASQLVNSTISTLKMCKPNDEVDFNLQLALGKLRTLNNEVTNFRTAPRNILAIPSARNPILLARIKEVNELATLVILKVNRL